MNAGQKIAKKKKKTEDEEVEGESMVCNSRN